MECPIFEMLGGKKKAVSLVSFEIFVFDRSTRTKDRYGEFCVMCANKQATTNHLLVLCSLENMLGGSSSQQARLCYR